MSKKVLDTLFDSKARVKILKLLFHNSDKGFDLKEIAARTQERPTVIRKEVKKLLTISLLNKNYNQNGQKKN